MHFINWLRSHFDSFPGSFLDPATTLLLPFKHFYGQEEVCIYAQYVVTRLLDYDSNVVYLRMDTVRLET